MLNQGIIRTVAWRFCTLLIVGLFLSTLAQAAEITVGEAIHHDTSAPMSYLVRDSATSNNENKQVPIMERENYGRYPDLAAPDGGLQSQLSPNSQLGPTPGPIVSTSGLSEQDNNNVLGFGIVPPDINGDIGLDDAGNRIFIQYINSIWGVFDVNGALINGPFAGNSFWAGFGGACETNNDGDPVVLYDDQAGQWFFSQFSISQGIQCVAISTTSDPLGPYHRYAFAVTPGGQNDYPKLGVWDDGTTGSSGQSAYTFTLRDFGGAGGSFSVSAGVMERDAMLTGAAAQFIKFSNPCTSADCIEGQLPQHQAGPTPPAGTCPTFWAAVDSAYDDSPHASDGYRNHKLCVDWSNLGNTTYTEGPLVAAGSNFDRFLGGGFSNCIGPVNGGEVLDCLAAFTMNRPQYRWFGSYGSVVFNTTVDAGNDRAGIRWTEIRSADGDTAWALHQDGTYAPADGLERWMGSVAQDQDGNIALGYSVTGASLFPSVRYASRQSGDAAGTLPGGEVSCHEGTGAQIASSNRWGDYSSMSVDPTDDCTFWFTQEYYETTGSFDFNTRICSFKFAGCGGPPPPCTSDASCDDGAFCNGAETCDLESGVCEPGTPPSADDGVGCTDDSCNEDTDSIDNVPNDGLCDNGMFCDGAEICDPVNDCQAGTPECDSAGFCDEDNDVCTGGCGDGVCDAGEDCSACAADCISGSIPGAVCGNGLCESGNGENGVNCSTDCNSKLNGKPSNRFSCGAGDSYVPDGCGDSRCISGGYSCTETPVDGGSFCCGDGTCEGDEDSSSCEIDCNAAGFCGDGFVDSPEQCDGANLDGKSCTSLGFTGGTLTCDGVCSFDTSACTEDVCEPAGNSCDSNSDCCSNKCKGKPGNKTCN